jgi:hypothetical protein
MRKLFKERKLFKGGNYVRKYGTYITYILAITVPNDSYHFRADLPLEGHV